LTALNNNESAFEFASERLKNDDIFVLAAVNKNGCVL